MENLKKVALPALAGIVVIVGGAWIFWPETPEPSVVAPPVVKPAEPIAPVAEPEPAPVVDEPEEAEPVAKPEPVKPAEPEIPVPESLNESDPVVRSVVGDISSTLVKWLTPEEQVRKWVLAVDLMAGSEVPKRHQPLAYPMDTYKVKEKPGDWEEGKERYVPVAGNDARLNAMVDALVAIPPRTMGQYYRQWLPVFEEAYQELGKQGSFSVRMEQAVNNILQVEGLEGEPELHRPHVFYQYVDPELEQASAVEKALWRAGDENREKLQQYLRELKFYL